MMNAAMLIAPAASMGEMPTGTKTAEGQGQFFGQALAQQEQMAYQAEEKQSGLPLRSDGLTSISEQWGKDAGDMLFLQSEQHDLLEQLEQLDIDMELLDGLALLLEQGMVPNSMDQAKLQQLVNLVEEVLPHWQFHNQVVTEPAGEQALGSEFEDVPLENSTPEQQDFSEQQMQELVVLFDQYLAQGSVDKEVATVSERPQQVEQDSASARKLEQLRVVLQQVRAAMQQAETKEGRIPVAQDVTRSQDTETAAAVARMTDAPVKMNAKETQQSPLESRFSELLKPRQQHAPQSRSGESVHYSQQPQSQQLQPAAATPEEAVFTKVTDKTEVSMAMPNVATAAKQVVDGSGQQNHFQVQQPPVAAVQTISTPTPVTTVFAGNQQVPDSQIFDQVVTHLSGSSKGESGRMVLRLHPAELGALRIELMVEGDRVRANLHAQSQQVQEVLERNLGQLRSALAEQGLKIDHFQVNSDARQNQHQEQAQDLARRRAEAEALAESERNEEEKLQEDQNISLAHLLQNGGRGISLHV